jgi:hypothetical protein
MAAAPVPQVEAEPGAGNVGTAVQVVLHRSFEATADADQCVGAGSVAPVRRGSSVILSEASASADGPKVALGNFFRSRMKDGTCQVLYITSAPITPAFNVQFAGPAGELSPTFGPNSAEPVTDQPGIAQLVRVEMEFGPRG